MRYCTCLFICCIFITRAYTARAQPSLQVKSLNSPPAGIVYKGNMAAALQWTDQAGTQLVLLSETGEQRDEDGNGNAGLFAYHYSLSGHNRIPGWKLSDFVHDCPVDFEARFIPAAFRVTDLDHNGLAEVWMLYRTSCRGDVSPGEMKLIMYQAGDKYGMRGQYKVKVSATACEGGAYTFDRRFKEGPKVFRDFAEKTWKKHVL